ncbi:alpha/beta hydrolase [Mycolicibacterium boenickei]|jgi:pimeloyl-ACP methyl ester carboxylesterase|nr:alpha/beta hydrolase [Mycolicibacterium boenickei]
MGRAGLNAVVPEGMIAQRRSIYAGVGTRELFVEGDGPTIVLVHGFAHPADSWRPVLRWFAAAGQAAVAVDLPGFGAADPAEPGPWLPQGDRFLGDVIARHSENGPVVLVGNSLGAALTVRAAASPLRVSIRGIVPTATPGLGWTPLVNAALVCKGRLLAGIAAVGAPELVRRRSADRLVGHLLYGERSALDTELVRILSSQIHDRRDARELLRRAVLMKDEVDAGPAVTGVTCPAVIVHGRRDRIVALASSKGFHLAIPHSRLVVLPRAGHCPQLDAPDAIAVLARELTARVPRSRRSVCDGAHE